MADTTLLERPSESAPSRRPDEKSYDTGYEHSVEHWMYIRCIVSEEDDDILAQPLKYRTAAGAD